MYAEAVEVVGQERATLAAFLPARAEHKVIDDKLASPVEQIGECHFAAGTVENVLLFDSLPWQLAAQPTQLIAQACKFFLLLKKVLSSRGPFVWRHYSVIPIPCASM